MAYRQLLFVSALALLAACGSSSTKGSADAATQGNGEQSTRDDSTRDATDGVRSPIVEYFGMCDASAAVALDNDMFLVADDERNVILAYQVGEPGKPVATWDWTEHLAGVPGKRTEEADVEGATRVGDTVYWLASHGRNLNGKWRPSRHQFFATRLVKQPDGKWDLQPVGQAYSRLAARLVQDPQFASLELRTALGDWWNADEDLAPKEAGLSIEGLAASADGQQLWIGFRNPLPGGKALLVPLMNAQQVIAEGADPKFGPAVQLLLHVRWKGKESELAVRSIEFLPQLGDYLIVAGRPSSQRVFALYAWSGAADARPRLLPGSREILQHKELNPEALVVFPNREEIMLLSDDGTRRVKVGSRAECAKGAFDHGECEQKFLLDPSRQSFGSIRLSFSRLKAPAADAGP